MKQSLALADQTVASLPVAVGEPTTAEGALIDLPATPDGTVVPFLTAP